MFDFGKGQTRRNLQLRRAESCAGRGVISVEGMLVDEMLVEEMLVEEMLVEEILVEETLVEETLVEETLVEERLVGRPQSGCAEFT